MTAGLRLGLFVFCGCSAEPRGVVVDDATRQGPPVLASEVAAASRPEDLVDASFLLTNTGQAPITLSLTGLGCSCYQLHADGGTLARGDDLTLGAGESNHVRFSAHPRPLPGETNYRATFAAPGGDPADTITLSYLMRTLADVSVRPEVIHHRIQSSSATESSFEMVVERLYRGTSPRNVAPACVGLPLFATCGSLHLGESPEQISPGLWREKWTARLDVHSPSADVADAQWTFRFVFDDQAADAANSQSIRCTLLVHREFGIQAPHLVHFGRVSAGDTRQRRILLRAADGRPFQVHGIRSSEGVLRGAVVSPDASAEQWIDLVLQPMEGGTLLAEVSFQTDHPDTPVVTLKARATIAPAEALAEADDQATAVNAARQPGGL